jgi:sulfofructose kinase
MDAQWDIIGLGSSTVDDLFYVPTFPPPDTKTQITRRERQGGGLTATALVTAARLGVRAAYAGALGHDEISRYVEADFRREGVDTSTVVWRDDAAAAYAVVIVDMAHHSRTIFFTLDGKLGADDTLPSAETIRAARVLHIDDYGTAGNIRAAKIAREAGIPVLADFERNDLPVSDELLGLVDHLIVGARFGQHVSGASSPAEATCKLWTKDRALVAITCGAEGSWYTTDGKECHHQPAFQVEAIDTTGCGDVYHGAYAAALIWGYDVPERMRFASAAAALKATQPGGRRGIPNRQQVEAFLQTGHER